MCASVCVCLSAIMSPELHIRSSPIFLRVLPMAVARPSSGGVVICCVLPVLWMTSCLPISHGCSRYRPAEAQRTRSLGLGYKLCAVIPVAGQRTHKTTFWALKVTSQVATANTGGGVVFIWHHKPVHGACENSETRGYPVHINHCDALRMPRYQNSSSGKAVTVTKINIRIS